MSTRMAPVSVDRINNEVYVGQLLFPNSIQSAVDYAMGQGVAMDVIVPQGYTGGEAIETINGNALVNIIDERGGQRQPFLWYENVYMPEPMTQRGGISSFQLNHYLFAGIGRLTTIQSAIDYAVHWGGSFFIVITTAYSGTENIADLVGANDQIFLSDQRTDQILNYHWDGTKFVAAPLIIPGDVTIPGNLTVAGATTLQGLTGTEGHFDEMLVDDSPVRTFANSGGGDGMIWPTEGIAVSTGEAWVHPSLDPASLLYIPITNDPQVFTTAGLYLGFRNGRGQIYNQSGGGTNSGMDWYSVDAYGNKTLLAQFSSGQLRTAALVATATVAGDPQPNSIWMDNFGRAGRLITVGPSVGEFNGIDFLGIDSNSSNIKNFANMTVEGDGIHFKTDYFNSAKGITSNGTVLASGLIESYGGGQVDMSRANVSIGLTPDNATPVVNFFRPGTTTGYVSLWPDSLVLTADAGHPLMRLGVDQTVSIYGNSAVYGVLTGNAIRGNYYTDPNLTTGGPFTQIGIQSDLQSPAVFFKRLDRTFSAITLWDGAMVFQVDGEGTPILTLGSDGYAQFNAAVTVANLQTSGSVAADGGIWTNGGLSFIHGDGQANFTALNVSGVKNFKIPHPLDPDHKWLIHSSFEGPEMGLIYRGEGETIDGVAVVELPNYFEALVTDDLRSVYITAIDDEDGNADFAMFKASRVREGKFTVKSSVPSAKFCWEVIAKRGDIPAQDIEPSMTEDEREQTRKGAAK